VTPVERRNFNKRTGAQMRKTLEKYADAVKAVAAAKGVPFVDLNDASGGGRRQVTEMGRYGIMFA